jgi:hypothetical protein
MAKKKNVLNLSDFEDERRDLIEFFKELVPFATWDSDDEEKAEERINCMFEVFIAKIQKAEATAKKQAETIKQLQNRLSDANFDLSYPPLDEKALAKINSFKIRTFRLNPENARTTQIFRFDEWNGWHWQDIETFPTRFDAQEHLKEGQSKYDLIYLRFTKNEY